jgi:diacylglycerol kinase family enzyme
VLGRLARRDDVMVLRCRSASVSAAEPLAVQADGEIVASLPVTFAVANRPLHLVRP